MNSILLTEDTKPLSDAVGVEPSTEKDYLRKKDSFLTGVRNHLKSVRAKYAWMKKRQHFMQGIRKHYNSSAYDRRKRDLGGTLKGIRDSVAFINKVHDLKESGEVGISVNHYEDFQLIQEAAALLAVVAQQARVFDFEESYAERAEVGGELIGELSKFISCISERLSNPNGEVKIPQKTLAVILDALSDDVE